MNARFQPVSLDRVKPSRKEDLRLITGQGCFTADVHYEGELHLHVIRSMYPHGRLTRVDLDAVRRAPGVVAVFTATDVQAWGLQAIPNAFAAQGVGGVAQQVNRMPVLAQDRVLFVGQPIAMVLADSALAAQDAAELAQIDIDPLPAVASVDAALAEGATQLHDSAPGNVSVHFEAGDAQAVEAAFARAAHVSHLRIHSQRLMGVPMEPRAVVVHHDAASGITRVHSPNQGVLGLLGHLSAVTGIAVDQLQVDTQDVGGSFGVRIGPFSEHAVMVMAARQLARPVRWVASRSEVFLSDWHGRALTLNGSIALDAQGKILALRYHDQVDLGAFNAYMSSFIGTRNLSVTMGGVYQVPALYMRSDLVYTNTTPVSAYRGAGRPDIAFAIERLVDHAAHEHGFDPIALRRANFIAPDAFPFKTANGTLYDRCEFDRVLTRALEVSDYAGFARRKAEAESRGKLRGIGLASYLEASGAGNVPKDQVEGRLGADGWLEVIGVTGASGQGHETSFSQIVERELGLPAAQVRYRNGTLESKKLVGNGTGGSRTLYGAGSAMLSLAQRLKEQVIALRAEMGLGAGVTDWNAWLSTLTPQQLQRLEVMGEASSGSTFPNGCHVAEVEIDPNTGVTEVVQYWAVDDLGKVISPDLVRGQVHGGVVQGWGQAFCEQVVYDEQGQLVTGSLMDYAMPRLGDMPVIRNETIEVPTELNALGSKGVGESGCTGSLPALSNAMMSALRPFGVQGMDMPFTPAKVWSAIHPE
jgi:aerobic carbon-monoxide dehydrogenase large subunit